MEQQQFDLLWLPEPIETCLHHDTPLRIREVPLDLEGSSSVLKYTAHLAHCSECRQWYGLLPVLQDMLIEADWEASEVDTFVVNGTPVTSGVFMDASSLSWSSYCDHLASIEEVQSRPTPSAEEVRALDQSPTTWEVGQGPATWIGEEGDELELSYAAVVHDPTALRTYDLHEGRPFDPEQIAALIRRAAGTPQPPAQPTRPRTVRVRDETLAAALEPHLSALDIEIEVDETPLVDDALAEMTETLVGDLAPPVFDAHDEAALRSFIDTAVRFYDAEPWTRTEGDRFLGVRIDDGPWFFSNVMGQLEDSPGLSVFDDWLTVCRFIHNERSPMGPPGGPPRTGPRGAGGGPPSPIEAAGALEALSLFPRDTLHPVDAHRLDQLGIDPPVDGQYPVPRRFDAQAGPVQPHFDLDPYRLTMEALRIALERRRATPVTSIKTTLDLDGRSVSLRYPSDGTERPLDGPPGHRFVVSGQDEDVGAPSRIPEDTRFVIDAAASTLFKDVGRALGGVDDRIYQSSLYRGPLCLWDDQGSRRNPSPRVADLADLDDLALEIGGGRLAFEVDRPLDDAPEEPQIERV
ncbi:MAG: hypothetical protein ABEL51_00140 [Salinibacter sp.]